MKRRNIYIALLLFGVVGTGAATGLAAAIDAKQAQIVAKVFNFLDKKPADGAIVVVTAGAADVPAVKAALGALKVVEGSAADAKGAFAVFVGSAADAAIAKGANPGVITIGNDVGCVDAGACVLVVQTQPKVSIFVSRAAAASAGIEFDTSFKMLLTER